MEMQSIQCSFTVESPATGLKPIPFTPLRYPSHKKQGFFRNCPHKTLPNKVQSGCKRSRGRNGPLLILDVLPECSPLDITGLATQLHCCTHGRAGIPHPHFLKQSATIWTQIFPISSDLQDENKNDTFPSPQSLLCFF